MTTQIKTTWQETTLGEVAEINPSESLDRGRIAKYVAMENIGPFTRQISKFAMKAYNGGMKFRNGDTLLARITPCLENGKTSYVDFLNRDEVGFGSTEFIVIREKEDLSDEKFLYYLAISPRFREIAIKSMTGTSGRQRVQTDLLANENQILLPPLPEQRAIAAVLSSLDDKIELLREQNKTLEATAQAIFKEWFAAPSKALAKEGELPKGWRVGNLTDIAEYLNGLALQRFPPESQGDYLPVIKIKEMKSGITEQTDKASKNIEPKYLVNDGDILFSWSGSLETTIWQYGKGALNQHLFKVTSEKYPKWFYYFWTLYHLPHFKQLASAKAVTMGHIQRHHLEDALVAIPDSGFLEKADQVMAPILEKIIANNSQIKTLSKLRDTLLPKLMKGEVRARHL